MSILSFREREILKLRFGINRCYTYTREEVGRMFKVTRERIKSIERRGLEKLFNRGAKIDEVEREVKKLRKLFAPNRSHDDKSILDDLDIASTLLRNSSGEIGFALCRHIEKWTKDARKIINRKG